jgi:hypothetical protein
MEDLGSVLGNNVVKFDKYLPTALYSISFPLTLILNFMVALGSFD